MFPLWVAGSVVVLFVSSTLSDDQAGAALATLTALLGAWHAWRSRPIQPAIFSAVITTVAALLASFGFDLSPENVAGVQTLLMGAVGVLLASDKSEVTRDRTD